MLFPGGAREALHGKGEEYKLFWPEKVDFVRMAGLFDAIIVPFSSIGIAESVNIFFFKTGTLFFFDLFYSYNDDDDDDDNDDDNDDFFY
jgi:hypothetical protein